MAEPLIIPTAVVDVRGRDRKALEASKSFVYVGRAVPRQGWKASPWGNPFRVGMTWGAVRGLVGLESDTDARNTPITADESVRFYTYWLMTQKPLLDRLHELQGKILGCWCCDYVVGQEPVPVCHAVTLARLADEPALRGMSDLTKPPWTLS